MSTVDRRNLLDDTSSGDYSTASDGQQTKTSTGLSKRNQRIILIGAGVLVAVIILAVILDFAVFNKGAGGGGGDVFTNTSSSSSSSSTGGWRVGSSSSSSSVTGGGGGGGGDVSSSSSSSSTAPPAPCNFPTTWPTFDQLTTIPLLPDPFLNDDGSRITTRDEWYRCRREIVSAQMQYWELGMRPPRPAYVRYTVSPNNIAMVITAGHDESRTINFTIAIRLPTVGQAPYPAMMGAGGVNLNTTQLLSMGVALLTLNVNEIALQNSASSRGIGKFYDLYGKNATAGALIAWSWAAGVVFDVLEMRDQQLIDPRRVGVTGCSRNGKGALVMAAFEERFVLSIPQESGSGGIANWRISDWQGTVTQTLGEITGENVWYTQSLSRFNQYATKLPFDHHSLIGLVAPRALLSIDNPDMIWLGNMSSWGGALAGRLVYTALGVDDRMGVSQYGHGDHCAFKLPQWDDVDRYVRRFLLGDESVNTTLVKKDREYPLFSLSDWVNWTVPALS